MKRSIGFFILIGLFVAAAAGFAWHAWNTGKLPGSSRAPSKENFAKAIVEWQKDMPEPAVCHFANMFNLQEVENYSNGARNEPTQGVYGTTWVPEIAPTGHIQNIKALHALAKSGYYTEKDTTYVDGSGIQRAAKRYQLTLQGWYHMGPGQCLHMGPRVFNGVNRTAKLDTNDGSTAYDVFYEMKLINQPAWATVEDADTIFGLLGSLRSPVERKATVIRMDSGWVVGIAKVGIPGTDRTGTPTVSLAPSPPAKSPKVPSIEEYSKLFANGVRTLPWANAACLMLPSTQWDADEVGDFGNTDPGKSYYAVYYDDPNKNPATQMNRTDGLGLMRTLQALGMVDEETTPNISINGQPNAGGSKFTLKQTYKQLIDPRTPGCLPVASLTHELKLMSVMNVMTNPSGELSYTVRMTGVAKPKSVQPWVFDTGAVKQIPLVKWIVEEGLPLSAEIRYTAKDGFTHIQGFVPRLRFATMEKPEKLFADLPRFTKSGTVPSDAAGDVHEVHAISVYSGQTDGPYDGTNKPGVVLVTVGKTATPVELYLSAYDPVLWKLAFEPGSRVTRVVAVGVHPQRLMGIPASIQVENTRAPFAPGAIRAMSHVDGQEILKQLRAVTNLPIKSVQLRYTGIEFSIGTTVKTVYKYGPPAPDITPLPFNGVEVQLIPGRRIPDSGPGRPDRLYIGWCGNKAYACASKSDSIMCNGQVVMCR